MFLPLRLSKDVHVEWKDNNSGYVRSGNSSYLVYKQKEAIKNALYSFCTSLIIYHFDKWKNGEKIFLPKPYTSDLKRAYPSFTNEEIDSINDFSINKLPSLLLNAIENTKIMNDFVFLAKLGLSRNWKSGCGICLTDKIMGTTCTCGHTEIAVFKPCGHSVCANPCFKQFIEHKEIKLKPTEVVVDGQKFIMPTNIDININTNFECPLCREIVKSVFKAEDVKMGDFYKEFITEDLMNQINII